MLQAFGLLAGALIAALPASGLLGRVDYGTLAVPGAVITVSQGDRILTTTSAGDGSFRFDDLPDGTWRMRVVMRGFVTVDRQVTLPATEDVVVVSLTMQAYEELLASSPTTTQIPSQPVAPVADATNDALILLGTVTNGGATPFAQPRAVGNNRPAQPRRYDVAVSTTLANSAWNAKPYSFGGRTTTADTGTVQLAVTLAGPLQLPWILKNGPRMTLSLQRGVSSSAITQSARVPTLAERSGDFSAMTTLVRDPLTGEPFQGNAIPLGRVTPQAASLLGYYPLPNLDSGDGANYQRPVVTTTRQLGGRFQTTVSLSRRNTLSMALAASRASTTGHTLLDFTNERRRSSIDTGLTWTRTLTGRLQMTTRYQFTRAADTLTPHFAGRINVSGDAGVVGNDQRPENWGPPTVQFPGITTLGDVEYQRTSSLTHALSTSLMWRRGRADISAGVAGKLLVYNQASQFDPRGTVSFTGEATGVPFADFLLGLPAASSLVVNEGPIHLTGTTADAFVMGDIRLRPGITLNAGLRWEFEAPYTDASVQLARIESDWKGLQPRVAVSWRPRLSSTLVIRGGYGIYRNLGTYQSLALLLAQQPPFARSFSLRHGADTPLSLANPFPESLPSTTQTVAIDPAYRPGAVHSWQVTLQRELPAGMTMTTGYFGDRGTRLMQAFVPGDVSYVYITSNGTSDRHAGTLTVRRRLHRGFAAGIEYTLAKATDNASTFDNRTITAASLVLVEHWQNPEMERGPSSFDQRHRIVVDAQYTTRIGVRLDASLTWGSGLPFTPLVFAPVGRSARVGVRPRLTGVSPAPVSKGTYANPEAFAAPEPGTLGDAGRYSIRGPSQFSLDLSASRLFQLPKNLRVEWRIDARNILNRVTFSSIDTTIGSPQFGRPTRANAMRQLVTNFQIRF